jgi:hypothetical protein
MPDDNKFTLPEVLPTDAAELEALEVAATAAFEARYAEGVATEEDLAEVKAIAEDVRTVRAAIQASQAEPDPEPEPEPETGEEDGDGGEAPEVADAPEAASPGRAVLDALLLAPQPAVAEAPAPAPVAEAPAAPAPAPAPAPVAVAASAGHAPEDFQLPIAQPNPVVLIASADLPGIPSSSKLDGLDGLVAAMGAKARSISDTPGSSYPVASLQKPLSSDRNLDGLSEADARSMMEDLASPSLLASGGWCAPSEIIYDFACEVEAPPEMLTLPTYSTTRGGVRYPVSPTFRDFYALENNGLFTWTEQDDIDAGIESPPGPTKPCFHIPCVDFAEARLELEGLCVTAGNLTDRAYPELIRRYMSLVLNGHLHRMNARKIGKAVALADDSVTFAASFGAATALLDAIELTAADLRDQFSMSENAMVEIAMPRWTRGLVRVDVARREGVGIDNVSNADIRRYLMDGGAAVQFVSDWQLLGDPDAPALSWPDTIQMLVWLPGGLRELTGPSLDIAVARDSTLNRTNDFTVAFTEESYQVYKPGCGVRLVTVPVCPSGASGAAVQFTCDGESI